MAPVQNLEARVCELLDQDVLVEVVVDDALLVPRHRQEGALLQEPEDAAELVEEEAVEIGERYVDPSATLTEKRPPGLRMRLISWRSLRISPIRLWLMTW